MSDSISLTDSITGTDSTRLQDESTQPGRRIGNGNGNGNGNDNGNGNGRAVGRNRGAGPAVIVDFNRGNAFGLTRVAEAGEPAAPPQTTEPTRENLNRALRAEVNAAVGTTIVAGPGGAGGGETGGPVTAPVGLDALAGDTNTGPTFQVGATPQLGGGNDAPALGGIPLAASFADTALGGPAATPSNNGIPQFSILDDDSSRGGIAIQIGNDNAEPAVGPLARAQAGPDGGGPGVAFSILDQTPDDTPAILQADGPAGAQPRIGGPAEDQGPGFQINAAADEVDNSTPIVPAEEPAGDRTQIGGLTNAQPLTGQQPTSGLGGDFANSGEFTINTRQADDRPAILQGESDEIEGLGARLEPGVAATPDPLAGEAPEPAAPPVAALADLGAVPAADQPAAAENIIPPAIPAAAPEDTEQPANTAPPVVVEPAAAAEPPAEFTVPAEIETPAPEVNEPAPAEVIPADQPTAPAGPTAEAELLAPEAPAAAATQEATDTAPVEPVVIPEPAAGDEPAAPAATLAPPDAELAAPAVATAAAAPTEDGAAPVEDTAPAEQGRPDLTSAAGQEALEAEAVNAFAAQQDDSRTSEPAAGSLIDLFVQ